jgi:hypothetical protein
VWWHLQRKSRRGKLVLRKNILQDENIKVVQNANAVKSL